MIIGITITCDHNNCRNHQYLPTDTTPQNLGWHQHHNTHTCPQHTYENEPK